MCRLLIYLFIYSCLLQLATANIEQVRFFAPFSTSEPSLGRLSALPSSVSLLSMDNPAIVKTIVPEFSTRDDGSYAIEEYYLLTDLIKGSFYEFRVCWPANNPLDLKVGVVKASSLDPTSALYVSADSEDVIYAYIKYSSFYYSHIPQLMEKPSPVTFELILSKCTFLVVLGDSVIMQSLLVILGVVGWKYASVWYYRMLRNLAFNTREDVKEEVALNNECQSAFQELKLGKSLKFIIFALNDKRTEIVVAEKSNSSSYDDFLAELPENDCRYAIYDFEYELSGGEGKRSKICFFTWSPDTAPVRSKMTYASSKDAIRRALTGIAAEIQGTDFSEVAYESVLDKVSRGPGSH
ncbi:Cofilin/tropomyosin-type actin-binding protein-domain-containing protein [Lipomyces oligophaga]|uniref:Cofilin/tropomyosin-type actin-binding protein-domain-containing protein n=1 Tax=Lipomyces oligophaga TaxID=45792 RepID=UPI0034CF05C1